MDRQWTGKWPEGVTLEWLEVPVAHEMPRAQPSCWRWLERRVEAHVREQSGGALEDHIERMLAGSPGQRVLNVSAGRLAGEPPALPQRAYDLVVCRSVAGRRLPSGASLDRIIDALRPGGKLVIADGLVGARRTNSWQVARAMFAALPVRFRVNHSSEGQCAVDSHLPELPEVDPSPAAADSLPSLLAARLRQDCYVPCLSIASFFLDPTYGPNYHLRDPLDRALFDWIWQMDLYWTGTGRVEPERFFGIYSL